MTPHFIDDHLTVYVGDCREVMTSLADESVHCVVTSPPYFGLRDYGTATWKGGDDTCDHAVRRWEGPKQTQGAQSGHSSKADLLTRRECNCGAQRVDDQLGLEPTPEEYVANLVEVFREVRRVLRADGTVWLNLGDSYANTGGHTSQSATSQRQGRSNVEAQLAMKGIIPPGFKQKDLIGIPWMVAFALRTDGWYLRSDVIWAKPNPMPESVTDRPTKSHEYVFLLTKSAHYYFDNEAVREPLLAATVKREKSGYSHAFASQFRGSPTEKRHPDGKAIESASPASGRNLRSVWTIATQPYPGAHFATFPEKLVEPCVKAGTSERGVCPECGAPWARETARSGDLDESRPQAVRAMELAREASLTPEHFAAIRSVGVTDTGKARVTQNGTGRNIAAMQELADEAKAALGGYYREFLLDRGATTGWRLSCDHDAEPVPATVLDPFAGSGTTARVANRLGRRAILIDLSADYIDQAMIRNAQAPLGLSG